MLFEIIGMKQIYLMCENGINFGDQEQHVY